MTWFTDIHSGTQAPTAPELSGERDCDGNSSLASCTLRYNCSSFSCDLAVNCCSKFVPLPLFRSSQTPFLYSTHKLPWSSANRPDTPTERGSLFFTSLLTVVAGYRYRTPTMINLINRKVTVHVLRGQSSAKSGRVLECGAFRDDIRSPGSSPRERSRVQVFRVILHLRIYFHDLFSDPNRMNVIPQSSSITQSTYFLFKHFLISLN